MKKTMILLLKFVLGAALLFGVYVLGAILYAQNNRLQTQTGRRAEVLTPKTQLPLIDKDTFSILRLEYWLLRVRERI